MSGRSPKRGAALPPGPALDVCVESPLWAAIDLEVLSERAVAAALAETGTRLRPGCAVTLTFSDDESVRGLNREWRGLDKPTNVLSFQAVEPDKISAAFALGDLVLAQETVAREAAEEGRAIEDHVSHLIVHGVLHLLGYDHEDDEEAEEMEAIERRALARIGVADPYAGSEPAREASR
jgi:probable rRNA maturation factor